jgi:hypothetical protein
MPVQARTGRGIHGLPKVLCGPAMPDPYTPCGRATPQTAVFFPLGYPFPYGPVPVSIITFKMDCIKDNMIIESK